MSDDAKYYVLATKTKRLIGNGSIDAEIYTTHLNIFIMFIILYSFIILHFDTTCPGFHSCTRTFGNKPFQGLLLLIELDQLNLI